MTDAPTPEACRRAAEVVARGVRVGPARDEAPAGRDHYAGAVLHVRAAGRVVHESAHGWAQTHEGEQPLDPARVMRADDRFDLASVTKALGTTALAMRLHDDGLLDLDAPVRGVLPELPAGAAGTITARHLLRHRSGLPAWEPLYLHAPDDPAGAVARTASRPLVTPVGAERRYSDLGMILLGELLARLGREALDVLVDEHVCAPLRLTSVGYRPGPAADVVATSAGNAHERRMIATGEPHPVDGSPADFDGWRAHTLVGEVNDGNAAYALRGVAGHAGLFGAAVEVAAFGQALGDGMRGLDTPLARARTVEAFTTRDPDTGELLGLWPDRLAAADLLGGVGHPGFTGCELAVDPDRDLVVVLLTNRLHPDGRPRPLSPVWRAALRALLTP